MSELHEGITQTPAGSSASALDLVTQAARDGAADARLAAERMWESSGRFTARLIYTTCYTASYGVVFPAVLLARAIPRNNEAVRGLIDGAHDAIRQADQVLGKSTEPGKPALAPS
jgi:hypothetical protein